MGKIGTTGRQHLRDKLGSRANFSKTERRLYGHDIAAIPPLIKPLIGDTTPEAVVQPETEEELVDLVRWAAANDVPLPALYVSPGTGNFTNTPGATTFGFMAPKLQSDGPLADVALIMPVVWSMLPTAKQSSESLARLAGLRSPRLPSLPAENMFTMPSASVASIILKNMFSQSIS